MFKAIIIDDEKIARNRLKRLLEDFAEIEIISEVDNGKTAVKEINDLKPDLIFLDIEMPELDAFQVIEKLSHQPIIIFSTAYDQYALKAFEANSVDYIVKPVETSRLKIAIDKLNNLKATNSAANYSELLKHINDTPIEQFTVRVGEKIKFIAIDDISYIQSKDKVVMLYTRENREYIIDYTMAILELKLEKQFVRIHRSYMINKKNIKEAVRLGNGKYEFVMNDKKNSILNSSIGYSDNIKRLFSL